MQLPYPSFKVIIVLIYTLILKHCIFVFVAVTFVWCGFSHWEKLTVPLWLQWVVGHELIAHEMTFSKVSIHWAHTDWLVIMKLSLTCSYLTSSLSLPTRPTQIQSPFTPKNLLPCCAAHFSWCETQLQYFLSQIGSCNKALLLDL